MKDKSIIPRGPYCYDENGDCPYWSLDKDRPRQRNGYCAYLGKGDWDLNEERVWIDPKGNEISGKEIGLPLSLLWDQCKECGINEEEV